MASILQIHDLMVAHGQIKLIKRRSCKSRMMKMSIIKSQIGMQQVVSASLRKVLSDAFGTYTVIIEAFVSQ